MQLLEALHYSKAHAELIVQRTRVVPHNIKAAARFGALRSKSTYNDMSARFYRVRHAVHVAYPLLGLGKKVKHCAIVPNILMLRKEVDVRNISYQPMNLFRCPSQGFLRYVNCSL